MSDELTIFFKPLGGQQSNALERASYADLGLALGSQWLTLLEDREACTVSNFLRGDVHRLAMWFAANWWRLRWEPETRDWSTNVDWRMSHTMASAGGGIVWPNVVFASDGDSIAVASRPNLNAAAFEPVRYLNRFDGRITGAEFENKVDHFIERVISRLRDLKIVDQELPELWAEVIAERNDPQTARWRKLEAMAGYDPEDAPEDLEAKLFSDQDRLGRSAVEEMAAEARQNIDTSLQPMREVSMSRKPKEGGYRVTIPQLINSATIDEAPPWQVAGKIAAQARREWDLGDKPLLNKKLANLLDATVDIFSHHSARRSSIPFAVRKGSKGSLDVYLHSPIPVSRRFALSRLIGDYVYCSQGEKLLPATHTRTARQKFQRAFAQELLCPYKALLERMQTERPTEDDIAEAALYFHVSPLLVKTTLVNKGEIDRAILASSDQFAIAA